MPPAQIDSRVIRRQLDALLLDSNVAVKHGFLERLSCGDKVGRDIPGFDAIIGDAVPCIADRIVVPKRGIWNGDTRGTRRPRIIVDFMMPFGTQSMFEILLCSFREILFGGTGRSTEKRFAIALMRRVHGKRIDIVSTYRSVHFVRCQVHDICCGFTFHDGTEAELTRN